MFTITSKIGVDYGHRVLYHGNGTGKCSNIHGHRGTIEVTCSSVELHKSGEQTDMVLDFGFLKEVMLQEIDTAIDHGFVAYINDDLCMKMITPEGQVTDVWKSSFSDIVNTKGYHLTNDSMGGLKIYIVNFVPTAERLAEHFFNKLIIPVKERSNGLAKITNLRFWETPNNHADYPGLLSN